MKIKSIEFKNHKILGDLKLDFTLDDGKIADTIIFAGENGTGKTTIINTIYSFLDIENIYHNVRENKIFPVTIIELIVPDEFLQEFYKGEISDLNQISNTIRISINNDDSQEFWESGLQVELFDLHGQVIRGYQTNHSLTYGTVASLFTAIYSDVRINFSSREIRTSTALNLDENIKAKRSSDDVATEIAQLFVDITDSDSRDLALWVDEHPNEVPPDSMKSIRIGRFKRAFAEIFDDLNYYKVENNNGKKEVCFKSRNSIIRINQLSSGEKQIVFRGGFILKDICGAREPVIIIDEPEISLHPEWQIKILDFYKQLIRNEHGRQELQLFVVTHSPFIVHNRYGVNEKVIVLTKDNTGKIFVIDKPEYYNCNAKCLIEDAFKINVDYIYKEDKAMVFVEGETDEIYMKKAICLFGCSKDLEVNWIGRYVNNAPQNTGDTALNQAFSFLTANTGICKNDIILLYDSDTRQVAIDEGVVHKRVMPKKDSNVGFTIGVENMLNLPEDFDKKPFTKVSNNHDRYGMLTTKNELDKVKLAKYICEELDEELCRTILSPLKENIAIIEEALSVK